MIELLQELRVAQIGVQILFAGLITLAFTDRFARVDPFQLWTFVVTLLLAALTTGLLVAPAAVHRMTFGRGVKQETVNLGHRLFVAGLATLTLTMTGAVLVVLDVVVGRTFAFVAAGATGGAARRTVVRRAAAGARRGAEGEGARTRTSADEEASRATV